MQPRALAVGAAILALAWWAVRQRLALWGGEGGAISALAGCGEWLLLLAAAAALPPLASRFSGAWARRVAAAVLVFAAAIALLSVSGAGGEYISRRLFAAGGAALICLAAMSAGLLLLAPWADALRLAERLAFGFGLGLAALSLFTLALSWAGWLGRYTALALLAICFGAGGTKAIAVLAAVRQTARQKWNRLPPSSLAALTFVCLSLALTLPAAYVPPLDYDTLEYHLQLPREYLENGVASLLPHNMFSSFPQAMEMLTLLCLALAKFTPSSTAFDLAGVWMAQLVHFAFLPLLLLTAAITAGRLCPKAFAGEAEQNEQRTPTAGLLAAALVMACGQTSALCLATPLYVEIGLSAFLCLAALAVVIAWQAAAASRVFWGSCGLAGLCAGAAANCKYPGLLFVGAPVCLLLLLAPAAKWRHRLSGAALAGLLCWLLFSPWLARNAFYTGNPFYPLWNQLWRVKDWSEAQEQRFVLAHRCADRSGAAFFAEAQRVFAGGDIRHVDSAGKVTVLRGETLGALCLVLWPGLLFGMRRYRQSGLAALACWLALGFVLWFVYTHRLERFFYPVYILTAIVSGAGWAALPSAAARLAAAGALAASIASFAMSAGFFYQRFFGEAGVTALRVGLGMVSPYKWLSASDTWPIRNAMLDLGPNSKVMLLGNANPAWLPAKFSYAVVFSEHPLARLLREKPNAAEIRAELRRHGITHLCINWLELARLHATYHRAFAFTAAEQERLRDFLDCETSSRMPLTPPWRLEEIRQNSRWPWRYLGLFLDDHPLLFPGGKPAGNYGRAKQEMFRLL